MFSWVFKFFCVNVNCFFVEMQKWFCYVFFGGEEGFIFEEGWEGEGGGGVSDENYDKFYFEVYLEKY